MSPRFKVWLLRFVKIAMTVGPAWFVWRNIQRMPGLEGDHFRGLVHNFGVQWVILALFAIVLSHLFGAAQWRTLLITQGITMPYKEILRIYFVGLFFNNFMPGNVGGDFKRIYDIHAESGERLGAGVSATLFDRVFGLFFLNALALAVGVLFFVWDPEKAPFLLPSLAVFGGFCTFFAALLSRRIGRGVEKCLALVLPERFVNRFISLRDRFYRFRHPRLWLQVTLLSAVTQILRVSVHWFCGLAIGVNIAVSWYFYFIPIVAVVSALPISMGGFGPREFLAQSLFARVGVGAMESVLVQFLAYAVSLAASLFGAFNFLFHHKRVS